MTKRPPLAVIILVIVICFALGLLNVLLREPEDPSSLPTALPPSPFDAIDSSINSILIIGVDDLHSSTLQLRAIWIAAYRTHEKVIYLHGFPLDAKIPEEEDIKLSDAFAWTPQSGLGADFSDRLYQIIPLHPNLTIILDDTAFARTIDFLGGVEIRNKILDGDSVLTFLSLSWDRPEILLANQTDIIQSLIPKALSLPETPELTELLGLIPEHVNLSMEISQAVGFVLPLRDTDQDSIFIILPDDTTENE